MSWYNPFSWGQNEITKEESRLAHEVLRQQKLIKNHAAATAQMMFQIRGVIPHGLTNRESLLTMVNKLTGHYEAAIRETKDLKGFVEEWKDVVKEKDRQIKEMNALIETMLLELHDKEFGVPTCGCKGNQVCSNCRSEKLQAQS